MLFPDHRLSTFLTAFLVVCLISVSTVGAITATENTQSTVEQTEPDTDNTVTRIQLHENGTATWEIEIRTRLDTDDEVEAYKDFQAEFRDNKSKRVDTFKSQIESIVTDAEATTDRNMSTVNFEASTSIQSLPKKWGVITYRFKWSHFAQTSENQVTMGDVFGGGYFLSSSDSMTVVAPEGYKITDLSPGADTKDPETVSWQGQRDFADSRPMVEATNQSAASPPAQPETDSNVTPVLLIAALVVLGGGYYWRRSTSNDTSDAEPAAPPANQNTEPGKDETDDETAVSEDTDDTETETLLSDDEKVLKSLRENDGRMKQAKIVEELDWSSSKASRVLQRMADEDQVRRLQIGRENLIDIDTEPKYD